jgi:hypothetical protein
VNDRLLHYDRELLLLGPKRNVVLELWEVERYGRDTYGDPEYVSIYGMRPADWHAKGARLLGRTAVECTRDKLGHAIGKDVAAIVSTSAPSAPTLVVDPFVGSGNTLYWMLRHLAGSRGIGFESDAGVFSLTRKNVAALGLPIEIVNADYHSGLTGLRVSPSELLIAFIAPPWGNALGKSGLDLRRTLPPVSEIVDFLLRRFPDNQFLYVIQIYEIVLFDSLGELKARFDWSIERIYDLNTPGQNHGIVLGTKGWVPEPRADPNAKSAIR